MARTTSSDILIPEIFTDAVQAAFANKNAFMGSALAAAGAVVINDTFNGERDSVGNQVEVPYFSTLGDFVPNADGSAVVPSKISQTSEKATVSRDSLAFEVTRWGQNSKGGDAYAEAASQVVMSATRAMDARVIAAAAAAGGLANDVYSSGSPVYLTYDLMVDSKMAWGEDQDDVAAIVTTSRGFADMLKIKDSTNMPLLTTPRDGEWPTFLGMKVAISDRLPTTGSSMGAVTSGGTSPPVVTVSGTPTSFPSKLRIVMTLGGTLGVAKFKFSVDGGSTFSAEMTTGASVLLTDTAIDSLVGNNGTTGITAAFAAGTYNLDNTYSSNASLKARTMLVKKGALAFWYNRNALTLQTDRDILADSSLGAMHLYAAALRYRRRPGTGLTKPGVVVISHNVT